MPSLPQRSGSDSRHRRFAVYVWVVLAYTQLVILWGTYVRAAGAGNGCGPNWPLCDGQFLPSHPKLKMLIEFLHRASSGVDAVLIFGLFAGALWLYPRRHRVRRAAWFAAGFLVSEALLGAALVLFGWVGENASPARVSADSLHLLNTLLLLASILLTALWASGVAATRRPIPRRQSWLLGAAIAAMLVTAICGAMTALADTLFPATTLQAGLRQDWSAVAPLLERLRVIHPAMAIATGLFLIYFVTLALPRPQDALPRRLGYGLIAAVLLQWGLGALDVLQLAPIPLQILHLLGADLLWLTLIAFTAAAAGRGSHSAPEKQGALPRGDSRTYAPVAR